MHYECHYNTLRIASRLYFMNISAKDLWAYTAESSDAGICMMALLAAITKTTSPSQERPPASENKRKENQRM